MRQSPDALGEALYQRLQRLPTAVVSDVLAAMGLPDQVLAFTLRPIGPPAAFAGPALCFSGADGPGVAANARLAYETDRRITPGCIVVIATGAHRVGAVVGGNTVTSWRMRGCAAVVTDGLVRDGADFAGLPAVAAGVTPMNNRGRWSYRSLDDEIAMPGQSAAAVTVRPGDAIHGDRDGVLVVPRGHLATLVAAAEATAGVERRMRDAIEAGEDRGKVYDRNDRFGHVRRIGPG